MLGGINFFRPRFGVWVRRAPGSKYRIGRTLLNIEVIGGRTGLTLAFNRAIESHAAGFSKTLISTGGLISIDSTVELEKAAPSIFVVRACGSQ